VLVDSRSNMVVAVEELGPDNNCMIDLVAGSYSK
jgi:hypothetical protein